MCSLVILRRPDHDWPLLIAANRDELTDRPSRPPGRHWPDRPEVVAGLDMETHGSWLGLNDHGLAAAVLDRHGTLGRLPGLRSRGELVLEALDHAEAGEAAGALADLSPDAYRPFNLVIADPTHAYWLRHGGDGEIRVHPIPAGLHMLTAGELDDAGDPRIRVFLPCFRTALVPEPDQNDWSAWIALLQRRDAAPGTEPCGAMNLDHDLDGRRFATLSSSLIALPRYPGFGPGTHWLHADGAPDQAAFEPVRL
jgi:uncharacterized protein with NRDE domain